MILQAVHIKVYQANCANTPSATFPRLFYPSLEIGF